jgi:hypothetical protein
VPFSAQTFSKAFHKVLKNVIDGLLLTAFLGVVYLLFLVYQIAVGTAPLGWCQR